MAMPISHALEGIESRTAGKCTTDGGSPAHAQLVPAQAVCACKLLALTTVSGGAVWGWQSSPCWDVLERLERLSVDKPSCKESNSSCIHANQE